MKGDVWLLVLCRGVVTVFETLDTTVVMGVKLGLSLLLKNVGRGFPRRGC